MGCTELCEVFLLQGDRCQNKLPLGSVLIYYRPQQSCGKVMFLHLSVILFTGGSLSRGVSVWWTLCPGGLCPGGSLSGRPLLYGYVRAVRILLECILVGICVCLDLCVCSVNAPLLGNYLSQNDVNLSNNWLFI